MGEFAYLNMKLAELLVNDQILQPFILFHRILLNPEP